MQHLTSLDAAFLHFETPETPMHVGSLMLFELPEGYKGDYYEDVKELIGKRLHLCSMFVRKLASMPFELAEPVWIEDDDIDLDYHVRYLTLRKPGSMAQLEQLVARLHSSLLDRSRPLWEVYVIDGLENGLVGYYTKAHHSGIDGKAGVEMAKVFYDLTPEVREVPPPRRRTKRREGYHLGTAELLQAAVSNGLQQYQRLSSVLPQAIKAIDTAARIMRNRKYEPGQRRLDLGLAPKTIFNTSITNQRSYTTLTLSLAEIKALGKRVGGTVNSVVMAMCSSALRRFLLERDLLPKEPLIAMVPVSFRSQGDDSMNNQSSAIRVDLATEIADPGERFDAIHASSEAAKAVVAEFKPIMGVDVPMTGSPWLMTGMASLLGHPDVASRLPAGANVTISNVPGIPTTLYMAGARMLHYYPVSIPYHSTALNMTVQSYDGKLEFGLTACRRVVSQDESRELIGYLRKALKEIEALAVEREKARAGKDKEQAEPAPAARPSKAAEPASDEAGAAGGKSKPVELAQVAAEPAAEVVAESVAAAAAPACGRSQRARPARAPERRRSRRASRPAETGTGAGDGARFRSRAAAAGGVLRSVRDAAVRHG
ncbi:MAG: wax ester/triacylglycerol synthase family O-acyltransferase [Burkholderiaceae bacterium]